MIENIIDRISGDPVLLVVAAIVGIIALLFVAKKLFKIAAGLFLIALVVVVLSILQVRIRCRQLRPLSIKDKKPLKRSKKKQKK